MVGIETLRQRATGIDQLHIALAAVSTPLQHSAQLHAQCARWRFAFHAFCGRHHRRLVISSLLPKTGKWSSSGKSRTITGATETSEGLYIQSIDGLSLGRLVRQ
jgi:hypothetical protein